MIKTKPFFAFAKVLQPAPLMKIFFSENKVKNVQVPNVENVQVLFPSIFVM